MRAFFTTLLLMLSVVEVQSATLNVPLDYETIQAAVDAADEGDIVLVAPGDYQEHVTLGAADIKLTSSGGADVTFITATTYGRNVLDFPSGLGNLSIVEGFTIREADKASAIGIGEGNSPAISFCHLTDNSGLDGAGILCLGNDVVVHGCRFTNNRCNETKADEGAGIFIRANNVTVDSCLFAHNNAGDGSAGAIYIQLSDNVTVSRNVAYDNASIGQGTGFMYAYRSSNVTAVNNTVVGNYTNQRAAGISLWEDNGVDIRNNIIAFNFGGHGVWNYGSTAVTVEYNDVYDNEMGEYYGVSAGVGSISVDPLFFDIGIDDYSLMPSSPCIDAGDPDPSYNDADGSRNDMGAAVSGLDYELPLAIGLALEGEDATHVVNPVPTFVWSFYDDPASGQVALEIEVGNDSDWSVAEMWAPGEVMTDADEQIYAGSELVGGVTYYVRIRVSNGSQWGSWRYAVFHMNVGPTAPVPFSPVEPATVNVENVVLVTDNAIDPDGGPRSYDFEVYGDIGLSDLVAAESGIAEQSGQTSTGVLPGLVSESRYWWRVRCSDGYESSDWSSVETFLTAGQAILRVPWDYATIQAAIDASASGDVVLVDDGVYTGVGNKNLDISDREITIVSVNGPEATVIDCELSGRGFRSWRNDGLGCTIDGFTIRNGRTSGSDDGAAVLSYGSSTNLRNCVIEHNEGKSGAVYLNGGTTGNHASPTVSNCSFYMNRGTSHGYGGAIYCQYNGVAATVDSCLFIENEALTAGGAVALGGGATVSFFACTFVGNTAPTGGSLYCPCGDNIDISQSLIAFGDGGTAVGCGCPGDVYLTCCDIYGNAGGDWGICISDQEGVNGNFSADPLLVDVTGGDFHPGAGSPCLPANNSCASLIGALGAPCLPGDPDADGDGVCDAQDRCPGFDDNADADGDLVPDGCDQCAGFDDRDDADRDMVPDGCDICPGFNDLADTDGDAVPDGCDDCPGEYDPDQDDADADGIGDVCDGCPFDPGNDQDGDGLCGNNDNCPAAYNPGQADADGDGNGDPCDLCPGFDDSVDADGDGTPDACEICPGFDDGADADGDGVPDGCDICEGFDDNADADGDSVPDGCDQCAGFDDAVDLDGDTVPDGCDECPGFDDYADQDGDDHPDGCDNCPAHYNESQADFDSDGIGNVCDACMLDPDNDVDGDGVCGNVDNCPQTINAGQEDEDNDGVGTVCDNCPAVYNPSQGDVDGDGVGDACCCSDRVGDANGLGGDEPSIGDVSLMIDAKFISGRCDGILVCLAEADVNQSGGGDPNCEDITIGDIAILIDYLFITGPTLGLPDCL